MRKRESERILGASLFPKGGERVLQGTSKGRSSLVASPAGTGKRDLAALALLESLLSGASWVLSLSPGQKRARRWSRRVGRAIETSSWAESFQIIGPSEDSLLESVEAVSGGRGWLFLDLPALQDLLVHSPPFRENILPRLGAVSVEGLNDWGPAYLLHLRHLLRILLLPSRLRESSLPVLLLMEDAITDTVGHQILPPESLDNPVVLSSRGRFPTDAAGWIVAPGTSGAHDGIDVLGESSSAPSVALKGTLEAVHQATEIGRWLLFVDAGFLDSSTLRVLEQEHRCRILPLSRPGDLLSGSPQRDWRGTVSGVIVASDALHPAALLRNIRPFLAKEASVVLARPDRSGVDPAFFLSDRPSRDALERGISFHSGGHLPEDLAHFLGHLAVLVAHDTARLPGFTLGTDALVSTLGLPSSQGEDVLSRLEERGWVRSVRLHHLLSASPTGRLEVLGGPNLQAEVSRLCVPVGCTSAKRIRLNCEGRVLRELDAFQAATFLHHGKEMRWGDTVYRVTGHLSPARSGNLEVARGYRAETDTTGGDLGLNVTPLIELSGTKSLQSGPPILPFPDSLEEGLSEEGESLLFLPLLEGGVVALPSLDASWLSALADYAGEVFLGDLSQMRRWVGKNRRGQLALVPLSGSITVTIKGHRYRQARSSERGERQLPQPLTFERVGPFTALCSTLPTEAKAALFLAAKTLLPIQFEGLRDVLLFHHHSLKGLSWLERT